MKNALVAILIAFALVVAGCAKPNPDQKPVYFVPPVTDAA